MTEQTQPTDAELEACPFCGNANAIVYDDLLTFHAGCLSCGSTGSVSSYRNGAIAAWNRRAVLAKWGTPAGAGEVVAYLDIGTGYLDLGTSLSNDELLRIPKGRHALVIAGTYGIDGYAPTPQPTQAQAGVVPLTDEWIRSKCKEPWIFETAKQWVRMTEAAHGIKGADHG